MNKKLKIAVGMSGGVDSSVAALLLKNAGYDVVGITMKIWDGTGDKTVKGHACYGPGDDDDIKTAQAVCRAIDIPLHVFDCSKEYKLTVIEYFKKEYLSGRTPNPCVVCNQKIKFDLLPELAKSSVEFDLFATGHYARVEYDADKNRYALKTARDILKDQTYFLHRLSQNQLANSMFPLGELTKKDVRIIARENKIPSCDDPESQDFYDGDYRELIGRAESAGEIVDVNGRVLGAHSGVWNYTVGQRRGLGIASSAPLYVTGLDAAKNTVRVGTLQEALRPSFSVSDINWVSIDRIDNPIDVFVKTRSSHRGSACRIEPVSETSLRVKLNQPEAGIAAGQSAVFYKEGAVLGGGIIE